ncbi:LAFA_0F10220g1_1 [Lachancea sp. 'fantastica']|nr:LAFA_0F10220g1_1 [Lachancea sp. 'fantastica']
MTQNSGVPDFAESESHADGDACNINDESTQSMPGANTAGFETMVLDQLAKIQNQNETLKLRMQQMEEDQQELYLDTCKKLERCLRSSNQGFDEVNRMKEVFKEIVAIMSGERVRFLDHSDENVTTQDAATIANSQSSTSDLETIHRMQQAATRPEGRGRNHLGQVIKQENGQLWQRLNYPDFTAPNAPVVNLRINENGDADVDEDESFSDRAAHYRLNRLLKTVQDLAREYFEGLQGQPSVVALERRFGPSWRCKSSERSFFAKRMHIIQKIIDVKDNPDRYGLPADMSLKKATRVVENMRLGNNLYQGQSTRMTLNQLYMYLAKKMDRPEDYSLQLRNFARPRRVQLFEKRHGEHQEVEGSHDYQDGEVDCDREE